MSTEAGTPRDKQWLQEMCELVKNKLPENYTFVVFAFPVSGTDRVFYASSATRESAVAALKEWIAQSGDGYLKHVK